MDMPLVFRNRRPKSVCLLILVKNEADIIGHNIEFHLRSGVDFVIAMDNGSEDGTVEILEKFQDMGALKLIHEPSQDYSQAKWMTRLLKEACGRPDADWLILGDADEFWCPRQGDLKDSIGLEKRSVLFCPSRTMMPHHADPGMAPTEDPEGFHQVHQYEELERPGVEYLENLADLREELNVDWIFMEPHAKVMARAKMLGTIEQGNHEVGGGRSWQRGPAQHIEIHHYPIRSYRQFEAKVVQGGQAYERNPLLPKSMGWHWRRWHRLYQDGQLMDEYLRQVVCGGAALDSLRNSGRISHQKEHFRGE